MEPRGPAPKSRTRPSGWSCRTMLPASWPPTIAIRRPWFWRLDCNAALPAARPCLSVAHYTKAAPGNNVPLLVDGRHNALAGRRAHQEQRCVGSLGGQGTPHPRERASGGCEWYCPENFGRIWKARPAPRWRQFSCAVGIDQAGCCHNIFFRAAGTSGDRRRHCTTGRLWRSAKSRATLTPPLKPPSALISLRKIEIGGVIIRVQP